MESYLSERTQATRIGRTISMSSPVTSGIPQGSVFGPFLYCLATGDFSVIHDSSKIVKFIDDTTIIVPVPLEGPNYLPDEHHNMTDWSASHGLVLNMNKCKTMYFEKSTLVSHTTINNIPLCTDIKILGVTINNQLKWDKHINLIIRTSSSRLYAIKVLKPFLTKKQLLIIYNGLILPVLNYAAPIFVCLPDKHSRALDSIQNRAHRIICGDSHCNCNLFSALKNYRSKIAKDLLIKAHYPNHILHSIMPIRANRFFQPTANTTRFLHTFIPFTTAMYNNTFIE